MARYHELYLAALEKLTKIEKERSSIERLMSSITAFDAAIIVLHRHGLVVEFAQEMSKIEDASRVPAREALKHGKPMHQSCFPCERERDLKILDDLRSREVCA